MKQEECHLLFKMSAPEKLFISSALLLLVLCSAPIVQAFALVGGEGDYHLIHLDAMIAANALHLPTINGYSSSCPPAFKHIFHQPTRESVLKWAGNHKIYGKNVLILER